ncbi:tRNA (adenosine(37)-N6)-threonylcarbamoyltransferase complex dimerization subunit type 1 TsaB [Pseudoxanthomonas indica]|uniref:tRNA threonylcarbamoyladenosine biosynthesis protein TsaB n=1 Tax=Pseudoxanthomonas indica TaxID=428993 RepID=A0A1T5LHP4_9GAMM|nr:tRNA (adenosine(37)-N6)-threonylcarbamoyltransferase complex dimerization subunit type 1 TsaB [Pseudoxanthomonas indica]GGD35398.1 tRNA (adenosine(37)-N6)-threonylcarbamoyltransferase complex dimerization subunit type 1 TsaB [Pseudoxanthomonas indica]SKC75510.1 tRNA threonylcarbamoyladenosine biosynthesis protein TsaB [Pseudoxanthomonas indica]
MKLLAFETATEGCSVALYLDGQVRERFEIAPRRHAELALPWAEELLAEAGVARSALDAIAISRGPGAFTGVRLGIALGQGIALAIDRPLVPVSTLKVVAASLVLPYGTEPAGGKQRIFAAIDARMGEVYVGAFQRDGADLVALSDEIVAAPDAVSLPDDGRWHGAGTGFAALEGALLTRLQPQLASVDASVLPHASDLAQLASLAFARGEAVAPELVEPAYLRDNVALTLAEQEALRASK